MLRLARTNTKTTRCAIVFVHMRYDVIQNGAENAGFDETPSRPQDTQDYELSSGIRLP